MARRTCARTGSWFARSSVSAAPSKTRRPSFMTRNLVSIVSALPREGPLDFPTVGIVAEVRHQLPVLEAVRDHNRRSIAHIALFAGSSVMMVCAVMGSRPAVGES